MMTEQKKVDEFWNWFQGIAASLAADMEDPSIVEELDSRVDQLDPMLSWEIGPGSCEPCQLVISPNLNPDMRSRAHEIVSRAPVIPGWEFHSARRPKDWDYKLVMQRSEEQESIQLDASRWNFVLLEYPDGIREVLLQGDNLPPLDEDERWQAAAMTLESILGEDVLLSQINQFELVDRLEPRLATELKPIQHLRDAVLGS